MTTSNLSLEEKIKLAAYHLGFSLVGIASVQRPRTYDAYRKWINAGKHAGMAYLASERALEHRSDLKKILPECQSVIVTGTACLPENHFASSENALPRIASYALGDDYHDIIIDRLTALVGKLEQLTEQSFNSKIYTDTGPILERDLAQRAGLGWIGKNTCLINPEQGSYFLLGEILIDLPLQPDPPFEADRCGTCTRCIEACPTNCILPDRTIDSGSCISYLTIEQKGSIAEDKRNQIGSWIFGCDICQQVCPWNERFATTTTDRAFQPREKLQNPELSMFLALKAGDWLQHLRGSALERPRRRGLLRNAAIVAGNKGDQKFVEQLSMILDSDPDPFARRHAAWALGQISDPQCVDALKTALKSEADAQVRGEIRSALTRAG